MPSGQRRRRLDPVLEMLGGDPTQFQPDVGSGIIDLTYQVDDLTFSSPPRTHGRSWAILIPSAAAAQFSGFELIPRLGCWIRKMSFNGAGNATVHSWPGGSLGAMAANDPLGTFAFPLAPPESSDALQFGGAVFAPFLNQVSNAPSQGFPLLFSGAQAGRFPASNSGMTCFTGATVLSDFWLNAGSMLQCTAVNANTVIAVQLEIEWPADYWI